MGLVNDLQQSAEGDDVLTVLRRAKRVSAKLGRRDISNWLDHEQNGYGNGIELPQYRHIPICLYYNTNGFVPVGFGQIMRGAVPMPTMSAGLKLWVPQSISTIVAWLALIKTGECVSVALDGDLAETIRAGLITNSPGLVAQFTFSARYDSSALAVIPEAVKDKVLDWACELEKAGITGEGQSFSDREKQDAQTVVFHINNSTIDQLNSSGTNLRTGPK